MKNEDNNTVAEYLIAITWVDDCRYFGTAKLVEEYEKVLTENCKCTLEGETKEFVSIQVKHDIKGRTLELTQEDYWVKAVERFKENSYLMRAPKNAWSLCRLPMNDFWLSLVGKKWQKEVICRTQAY